MGPLGWQYFLPALVLITGLTAAITFNVVRKLRNAEDEVMASFHLKPEAAVYDFEIFAGTAFFMFAGFFLGFIDVFLETVVLTSIGRVAWVTGGVLGLALVIRWWWRFR